MTAVLTLDDLRGAATPNQLGAIVRVTPADLQPWPYRADRSAVFEAYAYVANGDHVRHVATCATEHEAWTALRLEAEPPAPRRRRRIT